MEKTLQILLIKYWHLTDFPTVFLYCHLFQISFGGYFARNYITLNVLGACCVTGMSYLIKKKILDDVGGLQYFGKYLAEDFFLSMAIHKKWVQLFFSFPHAFYIQFSHGFCYNIEQPFK